MTALVLILAASCLSQSQPSQDALAAAQALYADARYDEALKAFDALKAAGTSASRTAVVIEQGRAYCLLALDRKADADEAIETIVRLDPSFKPAEEDTPPKIRAAFTEVRRRALAGVLLQRYQDAKTAYDRKAYKDAAAGFGQVLALLDDADLVIEAGPRNDMRLVASAFLDLANAAGSASPSPQPAGAGAQPAAATDRTATQGSQPAPSHGADAPPDQAAAAGPLYDASATEVTPPVAQRTDVRIPDELRRGLPTSDVIAEVVVSAKGTVESVTVRQSTNSVLSALVSRAAKDWRYRPATKAGVPVRYRMMVKLVVSR